MRRPIRSHVANRRMFQGGGLSPFPRPTGILASSQPLVDQVAQNIVNPNRTMPMNQGGAARFWNGGSSPNSGTMWSPLEKLASGERQTYNVEDNWKGKGPNDPLNNIYNTKMGFSDFVRKNHPDTTVPSFTFGDVDDLVKFTPNNQTIQGTAYGIGPWQISPREGPQESVYKLINETLPQSTIRMGFNRPGEGTFKEQFPEVEDALVAKKPYSIVGTALRKDISEFRNLVTPITDLAKGVWDTISFNFSSAQGQNATNYVPDFERVELFKMVMQMGRDRPDLAPLIEKAAKKIISLTPEINATDLQHEIVRELTSMEKFGTHGGDGVKGVIADYAQYSDMGAPVDPDAKTPAELLQERAQDPESMAKMMAALNAPPGDPGSKLDQEGVIVAQKTSADLKRRLVVEQQQRKFLESMGRGNEYVMSEEMKRFQEERRMGQDPTKTIDTEVLVKKEDTVVDDTVVDDTVVDDTVVTDGASEEKIVTDDAGEKKLTNIEEVTKILQGVGDPPPEAVPVIEKIKVDASNNDLKQTTKTLEEYRDDFIKAMPEYEGMSKEEQGFAWIKMGMAIAAGQSPNAIENISKGVLATIDEFADDPKQKRLYKKQVEVSAAKYALENVRADTTFAQSLLAAEQKDNRAIKEYMVHKGFTYAGKTYEQGDLFVTTVGELHGGLLDVLPQGSITTEKGLELMLENAELNANLLKPLMIGSGSGAPSVKMMEDSLNAFVEQTNQAETNVKILTMVDHMMIRNAKGQVTGLTNAGRRAWNSVINTFRSGNKLGSMKWLEKQYLIGREGKIYQAEARRVANMMIKQLLGEGSKNVSNIDRELADEIVGLIVGWKAITEDEAVLHDRLKHIQAMADQNLNTNISTMRNATDSWDNIVNARGTYITEIIKKRTKEAFDLEKMQTTPIGAAREEGEGEAVLRVWDYFDKDTLEALKEFPGALTS